MTARKTAHKNLRALVLAARRRRLVQAGLGAVGRRLWWGLVSVTRETADGGLLVVAGGIAGVAGPA